MRNFGRKIMKDKDTSEEDFGERVPALLDSFAENQAEALYEAESLSLSDSCKIAYDKLKDNAYSVSRNYFNASKRLSFHNLLSQWTLSLLSLGLIIIPLLTVTNIKLQDKYIDFFSISLAVFVLTFSLLVGANNYAVRSEKMH
ncbi:MAG: hypothetical protein DCF12_04490 [Snowella sp.]|jgi:hypothetical protein|nr:MAG: hypothetical protein DCF12_04490 [Snowella sp.]